MPVYGFSHFICNLPGGLFLFCRYRLRSKVEIDDVTEELTCWQRFGRGLDQASPEEPEAAGLGWGGGVDLAGISSAEGNTYGWRWFRDPRLISLGFRGIFPSDTTRKTFNLNLYNTLFKILLKRM